MVVIVVEKVELIVVVMAIIAVAVVLATVVSRNSSCGRKIGMNIIHSSCSSCQSWNRYTGTDTLVLIVL